MLYRQLRAPIVVWGNAVELRLMPLVALGEGSNAPGGGGAGTTDTTLSEYPHSFLTIEEIEGLYELLRNSNERLVSLCIASGRSAG